MGNPGLCGNVTRLSFCSDKCHQKHRKNVVVSIIVSIASVLLLIACAIASCCSGGIRNRVMRRVIVLICGEQHH